MKKSTVAIFALLLVTSVCFAAAVYEIRVGKARYVNSPSIVDYVVKAHDQQQGGIGVFSIKVKFGNEATSPNTFNLYEIEALSGKTNTILGPEIFTNSFVYAPTPIYFLTGNTIRFENTETGADIDFAFQTY